MKIEQMDAWIPQDYIDQCTAGEGFDLAYDTARGVALDHSMLAARAYGHVVNCAVFGTNTTWPQARCVA